MAQLSFLQRTLLLTVAIAANLAMAKHQKRLRGSQEKKRKLISFGMDAPQDRYPYTVSVQRISNMLHEYAGTLIAPDIVLTTADTEEQIANATENAFVAINPLKLFDPPIVDGSSSWEILGIEQTVMHPDFETNEFRISQHNVRLLKLDGMSSQYTGVKLDRDPNTLATNQQGQGQNEPTNLRLLGWGDPARNDGDFFFSRYDFIDHLQVLSLGYISNEECREAASSSRRYGNLVNASLTDSLFCTENATGGYCVDDEGGPVILPGETPEDDLLVGLIPEAVRCPDVSIPALIAGGVFYPSLYGKVSADYDWIREQVCVLSRSPPFYLGCDPQPTVQPSASLVPSMMPSTAPPSISLAPSAPDAVMVTVVIVSTLPAHVGWFLQAVANGRVPVNRPQGTYGPFDGMTIAEQVVLTRGAEYLLIFENRHSSLGLQSIAVYFGEEAIPAMSLVYNDGPFELENTERFVVDPSHTFLVTPRPSDAPRPSSQPSITQPPSLSISPTSTKAVVTVVIQLGQFPVVTSWSIVSASEGTVFGVPILTYPQSASNTIVQETILLTEGETHRFLLEDQVGSCCMYVRIYLGTEAVDDHLLLLSLDLQVPMGNIDEPFVPSTEGLVSSLSSRSDAPSNTPSTIPTLPPTSLPTSTQPPITDKVMYVGSEPKIRDKFLSQP